MLFIHRDLPLKLIGVPRLGDFAGNLAIVSMLLSDCEYSTYIHTGGYFAGSLAIMTDAAHMLSDLAGFLISLFAIWVGSRPPSKGMSFGWHRAGVCR